MKDLIASLEAATKGSRELDAEIFAAISDDRTIRLGDGAEPGCYWHLSVGGRSLYTAPVYTASLDAALPLVPERRLVELKQAPHRKGWRCNLWETQGNDPV